MYQMVVQGLITYGTFSAVVALFLVACVVVFAE